MTDKVTEILEQTFIQSVHPEKKFEIPLEVCPNFKKLVKAYLEWVGDPSNPWVKENRGQIELHMLVSKAYHTTVAFQLYPPFTINRYGRLVLDHKDLIYNVSDPEETPAIKAV